jgi:hypothetical protein
MTTAIFTVGGYGQLYAVENLTETELIKIVAVLMRATPVRDNYNGTFELREVDRDNRPTITIVRDDVIVQPELPTTPTTPNEE